MAERNPFRTGQWLLLVSAGLFVCSIAFLIAGARAMRGQPPPPPTVETRPVADVRQIMNGIVVPTSTVIYDAVSTTVTADGVEETMPRNDEEWAYVATNAAALAESGNLLLMDGRAIDKDQWVAITREFMDASSLAVKAAEAQDTEAVLAAGSAINEACGKCHERYQRQ